MKIHKTITLRIVKPVDIRWEEIGDVIRQLQREIVPLYNNASISLYQKLIDPAAKLKNGNEAAIIRQWSTDMVYHPLYETMRSSYIALGITSKIRASFAGQKAKELKNGSVTPPMLTNRDFPLVYYQQQGFAFRSIKNGIYDDLYIDVPFPVWEAKKRDQQIQTVAKV